jgi:hypothetical protein
MRSIIPSSALLRPSTAEILPPLARRLRLPEATVGLRAHTKKCREKKVRASSTLPMRYFVQVT